VNDLNVVFFGLRRGGQHAVINWVAAHFEEPVWFFNDICDFNNPEPIIDDTGATKPSYYVPTPMKIPNVWQIPKGIVFQSYEDKPIDNLDFQANARVVGESKKTICVIILRDLFNTVASRMAHPSFLMFKVEPWLKERWEQYAMEAIGETSYLPNMVVINYNFWFRSEIYRRRLERLMGLGVTDEGMNTVSGVGSSFSWLKHDGKAQNMKVEKRWERWQGERRYMGFFRESPRIWELHDTIFGKIAEPLRQPPKIPRSTQGSLKGKRMVYVRIPKTASTTFKESLSEWASERKLRVLYQSHHNIHDDGVRGVFDLSLHHVVFNPINVARLRMLLPDCIFITSVRDPIERARSHYHHIGPEGHVNRFAKNGVPFSDWYMKHKDLESDMAGWKNSINLRHWTNGTMACFMGFCHPNVSYEQFCTRYAFIMVAERFELSLRVFEALVNTQISRLKPVRVAVYNREEIPQEVRDAFRERNELDYRMYEYGCRRLEEEAREVGCEDTICSNEG